MANKNQVASTTTQNIVPVQAAFNTSGQCLGLVGPGGAYFSPPITSDIITNATITGGTVDSAVIGGTTPAAGTFTNLNTTNSSINGKLIISSTAPTIASGFGTSPTITANSTAAFKVVVGTSPGATGTITFPAAPNGWVVFAQDVTTASLFLQQTASSTTSVTVNSYSITTGLSANMVAGDAILFMAMAY